MTLGLRLLAGACLVLAGAVVSVGTAAPASACSCAGQTVQQAYDAADAVFAGRLTGRREPLRLGTDRSTGDPVALTFAVTSVYKGAVRAEQDVVTASDGASCGLELEGDGPFLVFASSSAAGSLRAGLCDGTTGDLGLAVWTASAPAPGRAAADLPGPDGGRRAAAALALALAGALGVVLARRRRRGPAAG